ncbi:beta-glucoside-specific PTS transporter subunit IIABC [Enterococcus sp. HMSC072H05]|uniref:beta-glucoside-specific PTS transporter subunit IIABC n=1 Tax=Enterococcus sp. HMSC072H05 TaxID=1715012 RepID=UPI003567B165
MDYKKLGKDILVQIGGKENILSISHCVTRVRFVLKDEKKANDNAIKQMQGVLDVVKQGGQYQVVIGPSVKKVYDVLIKEPGLSEETLDDSQANQENDKNLLTKALGLVSSIFIPILGILSGAGMIKAMLALISVFGLLSDTDGTYIILNALSDVLFYFFPVAIGWSAAKRFGIKEIYGIVLGAFLVYPSIVAAATGESTHTLFSGTIFSMNYQLTFLGIPVALQNYASTVIPIIVIVWIASYVYKFFDTYIPDVLKMVFVPFFTLIVTGVTSLIIIGPISIVFQNILSNTVSWLINLNTGIAGFLLGAFWSILVMFGLHWAVIPFFAINVAQYGYDIINPLIFSGAPAILGATIGVAIRTRNKDTRAVSTAAAVSSFFGVSEPALYGILIPRKWVLITCLSGAGIGGAIAGLAGSKLYTFGAHGLLGLPTFINPQGIDSGFIGLCISGVVAFAFALISALIIGDKKNEASFLSKKEEDKKQIDYYAPVKGKAIDLINVEDEVFSKLVVGDGIAIQPSEGKIYAPSDAIVRVAYPTGHAIGLSGSHGEEILIHIGINTVDLRGEHFTSHIQQGMKVKKGDLLAEFDLEAIKKQGYDPTVMVIVTKTDNLKAVEPMAIGDVDTNMRVLRICLE